MHCLKYTVQKRLGKKRKTPPMGRGFISGMYIHHDIALTVGHCGSCGVGGVIVGILGVNALFLAANITIVLSWFLLSETSFPFALAFVYDIVTPLILLTGALALLSGITVLFTSRYVIVMS